MPNEAASDPEDAIEALGDTETVGAALAELDDDERQVIEARYGLGKWDGNGVMHVREVARVLMVTQRHVERCLRKATKKLRASLAAVDVS